MSLVPVEMLRSMGGLNPGEIAGFDGERAKKMIEAGVAKPYEEPKVESNKNKPNKPEA